MKETINQIRALLSNLESETDATAIVAEHRVLSGLELPDIICDVVDFLLPELKPYEAAFYLHFLRHSIIENGTPYIRASRAGCSRVSSNRPTLGVPLVEKTQIVERPASKRCSRRSKGWWPWGQSVKKGKQIVAERSIGFFSLKRLESANGGVPNSRLGPRLPHLRKKLTFTMFVKIA